MEKWLLFLQISNIVLENVENNNYRVWLVLARLRFSYKKQTPHSVKKGPLLVLSLHNYNYTIFVPIPGYNKFIVSLYDQ